MTGVERDGTGRRTVSRRRFLGATAVAGVFAVAPAGAQEDAGAGTPTTSYELGGQVSGWTGQKPSSIEGKTNPALHLVAGRTYTITWVNLDGQQHQLQVLNAADETVAESGVVSTQGATGGVEFEATPETTTYRCSIHPSSMKGELRVGKSNAATATGTPNREPATRTTAETTGAATAANTTAETTETTDDATTVRTAGSGTTADDAEATGEGNDTVDGGGGGGGAVSRRGQPGFGVLAGLAGLAGLLGLDGLGRRNG